MSNNRSGFFFGGVLLGAAIGTVTGLLLAPRTGRDTRKLLKKSADALPELAEDLSTSVQMQADRLSETALRNWDGTLTRLREAINAGIEASGRERQILSQTEAAGSPASSSPMRDAYGDVVTNSAGEVMPTEMPQER
ncbi:YtxH domain-containing protein [Microcoleus sp. FACHB-68]|uniref:YtxH domain-containing protein n=1 Tax=Microcoleus sp. FACHB-68 TaxID=2692826 RepID=UPI001682D352|nr:YtxH domain-containing protein [Microcoleus sp. FACHB-68]MBD1938371.1 YtxH domain-containing protein [Microcoleus sp. FACHB-68]